MGMAEKEFTTCNGCGTEYEVDGWDCPYCMAHGAPDGPDREVGEDR
jgi:hypothetical protein